MQPTDAERNKRNGDERRKLLLALFLLLIGQTRDKMTGLVSAYLAGSLQTEHVTEGLLLLLTDAHAMAVSLGRQMAGGSGSNVHQNRQFALAVMVTQTGPLANLVHDLRAGRYPVGDDNSFPKGLTARLRLYVLRLRGTANEAWGRSLSPDVRFLWRLGRVERHCRICPERAAESALVPYTVETLPGWPGDGSTPCLGNCDCDVEVIGGETGFPMPEDI